MCKCWLLNWAKAFLWFSLLMKKPQPTRPLDGLIQRIHKITSEEEGWSYFIHLQTNTCTSEILAKRTLYVILLNLVTSSFVSKNVTSAVLLNIDANSPPHSPKMHRPIIFPVFFGASAVTSASCHLGGFWVLGSDLLLSRFVLGFKSRFLSALISVSS